MKVRGNIPKSLPISSQGTIKSKFSKPRYIITVDTEEEFNWDMPFSRDNYDIKHISYIDRFQKLCTANNVKPIYLIDFPIVQNEAAVELIGQYCKAGLADVGMQLHSWVTPPFDERLSSYNSYACNLPAELERKKLNILYEAIISKFGIKPSIYRAGRYGAGAQTVEILNDLGVKIDTSVRSRFSYAMQHGPNYSKYPVNPYWLTSNALLELPVTTVFTGLFGSVSDYIYNDMFESKVARSFLSRANIIERIALTPEGTPAHKALIGIDRALQEKIKILNFSFHSPSLAPGNTPYVRNNEDLELFYMWWNEVFAHLALNNVEPVSLTEIIGEYFEQ